MNIDDTITAISTPPGKGAIALLRISGKDSFNIVSKIFHSNKTIDYQSNIIYGKAYFGAIKDCDEIIDEVLITFYKAPKSYTGEDMVEISCHGSTYIQERILQLIVSSGVRLADRGEFTMRAFLHGKMDLSQAEAVADLISSVGKSQHTLAMRQMRGGFSDKLKDLREKLVEFASLVELELDFSQEDVEFANRDEMTALLNEIQSEIYTMMESFRLGNVLKRGIPVAIAGRPNAGKSTLINAIFNEEKAIVSEIPGTTRDAIEDTIIIGDIPFRFIDTAGLRDETEKIEALGIEKTFEKISQAQIVLYIFDTSSTDIEEIKKELAFLFEKLNETNSSEDLENKRFILVANKIDMLVEIPQHFNDYIEMDVVFISAKRQENIKGLTDAILNSVDTTMIREELIVTSIRHYEALKHSKEAINEVINAFKEKTPTDLIAVDIRKALYHLGLITGEVTNEELLSNIFGRFCIGK